MSPKERTISRPGQKVMPASDCKWDVWFSWQYGAAIWQRVIKTAMGWKIGTKQGKGII